MRTARRGKTINIRMKRVQAKSPAEHIEITMAKQTRRKCAYIGCRKTFHPKRYWQKFCSDKCKLAQWKKTHPRVLNPKAGQL